MVRTWVAFVITIASGGALNAEVDVQALVKRSVAATMADWQAAPAYAYQETDRESGSTKTYDVTMIFGSPYQRLIAVDGKQLSAEDARKERDKLEEATARRKSESQRQRANRIGQYNKERERDRLMMMQIGTAFDFTFLRQQKVGARDVYVLRATPRKKYNPPNLAAKVLTGMHGELWIDKSSFHWVKATAHVLHPVSIEGFLARVEPGTFFELDKMPVEGGVWLPVHFAMKSHANVVLVFSHTHQEDDTFSDYRKQTPVH